mmetsp:Transcript_107486/g.231441  ORF Transcript_107486/g.231441 Transcript_107486/m.231441 type:complete len:420 (-) Transcript_107486:146-1405(-)
MPGRGGCLDPDHLPGHPRDPVWTGLHHVRPREDHGRAGGRRHGLAERLRGHGERPARDRHRREVAHAVVQPERRAGQRGGDREGRDRLGRRRVPREEAAARAAQQAAEGAGRPDGRPGGRDPGGDEADQKLAGQRGADRSVQPTILGHRGRRLPPPAGHEGLHLEVPGLLALLLLRRQQGLLLHRERSLHGASAAAVPAQRPPRVQAARAARPEPRRHQLGGSRRRLVGQEEEAHGDQLHHVCLDRHLLRHHLLLRPAQGRGRCQRCQQGPDDPAVLRDHCCPIRDDVRGEEPRGEGVPRLLHRAGVLAGLEDDDRHDREHRRRDPLHQRQRQGVVPGGRIGGQPDPPAAHPLLPAPAPASAGPGLQDQGPEAEEAHAGEDRQVQRGPEQRPAEVRGGGQRAQAGACGDRVLQGRLQAF